MGWKDYKIEDIEKHLEGLSLLNEKLIYLEDIKSEIYHHRDAPKIKRDWFSNITNTDAEYKRWNTLLEDIQKLINVEHAKLRSRKKYQDSEPAEDAEDQGGTRWNNSTVAVAIYALLRAANLPDKHNREAVARFTRLLTGKSENTMKRFHKIAVELGFTDKEAETVAEQFEKMGLIELAREVRQKFYKT